MRAATLEEAVLRNGAPLFCWAASRAEGRGAIPGISSEGEGREESIVGRKAWGRAGGLGRAGILRWRSE